MIKKPIKFKRGMSLVEVLVTTGIFTILSLVITSSIVSFYRFNAYTIAQAYQVSNARRGVESMVRDIREMTFADDGTFPIAEMEDHRILFYSDIDRDDSVELVEYDLDGTVLTKYVYGATGDPPVYSTTTPEETFIISEYVQNNLQSNNTFGYYDSSGVSTTPSGITDVRYVEVQVIVNIDPIRDPGEFMLRGSASLRNLKENL